MCYMNLHIHTFIHMCAWFEKNFIPLFVNLQILKCMQKIWQDLTDLNVLREAFIGEVFGVSFVFPINFLEGHAPTN